MMHRELLLLGLLRQQARHGYQLNEFIDQALSACTDLKRPTAYFLLDKMAAAGWIKATRSPASGRRLRRIFQLTPAGEDEFQRLLRENLSAWLPAYFPGDVGLAFADALPAPEARRLLAARRAALVEALATAQRVPKHTGSLQWVVDHQARHLAAELDWLDSRLAKLKARPARRPRAAAP